MTVTRFVYPADSPDAASSDFFLFVYLKSEMAGIIANSSADIFSETHQIFQEISEKTLAAVTDK
jgi:hypothetical protein